MSWRRGIGPASLPENLLSLAFEGAKRRHPRLNLVRCTTWSCWISLASRARCPRAATVATSLEAFLADLGHMERLRPHTLRATAMSLRQRRLTRGSLSRWTTSAWRTWKPGWPAPLRRRARSADGSPPSSASSPGPAATACAGAIAWPNAPRCAAGKASRGRFANSTSSAPSMPRSPRRHRRIG